LDELAANRAPNGVRLIGGALALDQVLQAGVANRFLLTTKWTFVDRSFSSNAANGYDRRAILPRLIDLPEGDNM
jgi:hypothetical protein